MSDFNFDFGGLFKPEEAPPKETKITLSQPAQKWEKRAEQSSFVEPQSPKGKQDYRIRRALSVPYSVRTWFATILTYLILPASICEVMFVSEKQGIDWGWEMALLLAGLCGVSYLFIQWLMTHYPSLVYGLVIRLLLMAIAIALGVISVG
jgi:hypothetical protein